MIEVLVDNILRAYKTLDAIDLEVLEELVIKDFSTELLKDTDNAEDAQYILPGRVYRLLCKYQQTNQMEDFLAVLTEEATTETIREAVKTLQPIDPKILEILVIKDLVTELWDCFYSSDILYGKIWMILSRYRQTDKMEIFETALTTDTPPEE